MADEKHKIELKTTELFHRHKRNLMLAASITIVLAVAAPAKTVKLPVVDADIGVEWAFALLNLAVAYFAMQFYAVYYVIKALNSQAAAENTAQELDHAFETIGKDLRNRSQQALLDFAQPIGQVESAVQNLNRQAVEIALARGGIARLVVQELQSRVIPANSSKSSFENFILPALAGVEDRVIEQHRIFASHSEMTLQLIQEAKTRSERLEASIAEWTTSNDALRRKFRTVSKAIFKTQRLSLTLLDGIVPALMTAVALALASGYISGLLPIIYVRA